MFCLRNCLSSSVTLPTWRKHTQSATYLPTQSFGHREMLQPAPWMFCITNTHTQQQSTAQSLASVKSRSQLPGCHYPHTHKHQQSTAQCLAAAKSRSQPPGCLYTNHARNNNPASNHQSLVAAKSHSQLHATATTLFSASHYEKKG
jgi:hypothetical protein